MLPALSHYFGIQPWHLERLTFLEIQQFLGALDDIERTNAAARR